MRNYKYEEILDEEVLNKFTDKQRKKISELILGQDYGFFIDVKKICKILDITIENKNFFDNFNINNSGKYIAETNKILIDPILNETEKRFIIARELHNVIFIDITESFESQINEKYKNIISKMGEWTTNNFATQLLMPIKLIKILMNESINKHKYNSKSLSLKELKIIISDVSEKLKVSKKALNYTIKNNKLITEI